MQTYFQYGVDNRVYKLSDITSLIKASLLELSSQQFWVRAHMVAPRSTSTYKNYYCDLIDLDDIGNKVAQVRAVIWQSDYSFIRQKLRDAGLPDALQDNSEVCVLCSVRYHEVYGLSLNIYDIDPTLGESQIDLNRRQIIEKLTEEGILKLNTGTHLPAAPMRIGLITRDGSAAFNDFTRTLFASPFAFKVILADCSMQGENTEREVLRALRQLRKAKVDLICIVRGGGSPLDLAWFDNEKIARAVIHCHVPVWVGIGHEIDTGVLDIVAHTSYKTPTAVAEALVGMLEELLDNLERASDRLQENTDLKLGLEERELSRIALGALNGFRKQREIVVQQFTNSTLRARSLFEECFADRRVTLSRKNQQLYTAANWLIEAGGERLRTMAGHISLQRYLRLIEERRGHLSERERQLMTLMPEQILRKGYTITRNERNELVSSVGQLQKRGIMVTEFIDGSARSIVQETEEKDGKAQS